MNSTEIKLIIKQRPEQPKPTCMPGMPKHERPEYALVNLFDKVKEYVEDIESGMEENHHQWLYLKCLYKKLYKKSNCSQFEKDMLQFIEPTIMKYAEFDGPFAAELDGQYIYQSKED